MQTPQGFELIDGEFHVTSWFDVIFNPSFPYRFTHMLLASTLTVAFLLAGLSAWQQLRGAANPSTPKVLRVGLTLAALVIPLQMFVGDQHGLNTLKHQPQKIAAIEAIWHTERGAPLLLFAWPDEARQRHHFELAVPRLGSLILTHSLDGEIKGLSEFPNAHPPVAPLFFAFRLMVGMGLLMLAASWLGWWLLKRAAWQVERLPHWSLWGLSGMTFSGGVATLAGWYVTEIGRQPFVVYGLVRTAEVASDKTAPIIATTLVMYVLLYLALIVAYMAVMHYIATKPDEPSADRKAVPLADDGDAPATQRA
jgi:cytochrome d ubiquinol oxidase subunit I